MKTILWLAATSVVIIAVLIGEDANLWILAVVLYLASHEQDDGGHNKS